ncbi:hemagglutinin repeat-containing protein [Paraburkholderia kururiensis]|uniref:hemagglutinin repeat-containing protein n=1 Tax=Paraburkholderia kururiensis TaxID=984307 RepID=UPI0039A53030
MLVAVEETATSAGKAGQGETKGGRPSTHGAARVGMSLFAMRHAAFGALMLAGVVPVALAQIVPTPGTSTHVVQTQNGIPQVNVARPSGAGVSMNTYSQFDVQKAGAIINNSPSLVSTQQAGYINGNPNYLPGQSAKVIVNQVNSNNPSYLGGFVEIGGARAELVIANSAGLIVNGAGFINTSKAVLTTGTPTFGADGALTGFDVRSGLVTVEGAGLNASNVDQVDIVARAVQANAAIYGNTLNVITGANHVDHDTLAATPIAGTGPAPTRAIDVSQLGGMYANRIYLASNEYGVGVSNAGVLAAQAGDLTLTTQGRLVLSGRTNASGNMALSAAGGIDNSGTTYAQQNVSVNTAADLTNSGTLAAQQNTDIHAGSVASTGTLGAGINSDGTVANAGDLTVSAAGALSATGHNAAGGNASLSGASVNMAGAQTSANGNLALAANGGNLNLAGATTTAGGALSASSTGTLTNDNGVLSSNGAQTVAAGAVSNQGGQMVSQSTLDVKSAGAVNNRQGILQAAGHESISAASLDNTAGRVTSLNGDGLSVTTTGALVNATGTTSSGATGGLIGGNGAVAVSGGDISNQGQITAKGDASVQARSLDNHSGSIVAGGNLGTNVTGALNNQHGTLSGSATTITAGSADNSSGTIEGDQLALSTTGDLVNRGGAIRQYGTADQTLSTGGTLDSTGGTLASNATNLNVSANAITNDAGAIQHAGAGTLRVSTPGALSNVGGQIATNGALNTQAGRLDNTNGTVSGQGTTQLNATSGVANHGGRLYGGTGLTATTQGDLDNSAGSVQTGGNLAVTAGGALSNVGGTMSANGAHGTAAVSAASIDNSSGSLTNAGDGATTVTAATAVTNTGGLLGGNGDVTVNGQTLANNAGAKLVAGHAANLNVTNSVNNAGGTVYGGTALNLNQAGAAVTNDGGQLEGGQDVSVRVASLSNAGGAIRANRDITASGAVSGDGEMTAGRNLGLAVTGDYTNGAANRLHADGNLDVSATGTLTNSGTLTAGGALTASGTNVINAAGADINGTTTTVNATDTITNAGRIEGDSVTTSSATLANTGAVIGNDVQVNATDVQNSGAAAVIAGARSVKLYASNSVSNTDGALIYSAGNMEIAKDGTRDASGLLANQTGTLSNIAANIEADGNLDIAAHTVNNIRTGVVTQAGTPTVTGTKTLSLWTSGLSGSQGNGHYSITFPQWTWEYSLAPISGAMVGALRTPISVTLPKAQVTGLDTATQTFSLATPITEEYWLCAWHQACVGSPVDGSTPTRTIANSPVQYYNSITDNGSTYTVTFWPDWNPQTNIRPDQAIVRTDLGPDSHDYNEIQRTVTTTTATDQLVSAGTAAKMQAQGAIRINADGGSINNQSSTMAAGGDLVRRANGGSVNDTGTVLQQTVSEQDTSTFYWHQKTGGDSDTKTVVYPSTPVASTTTSALPAIATSNQTVQTDAATINVSSVNRVGQTVTGSGVTGGNATGTRLGGLSGQALGSQTLGSASGGIPNLVLPVNGLYSYRTAPGATYLIATDPRFTSWSKFISSDYMLGQLGLNPQNTIKRLGDGAYEEKLIRDQVTQLTGRTFLAGYSDNLDEYTALMNSGVTYAKAFGLTPGIALTDAQMQQLTTDMVWLVSQDVTLPDGSHQTVLVPKLYLAQADTVDLQHSGALVAGNAVNLNATSDVNSSGHIVGDVATTVLGDNIVNRGVIGSGGMTTVAAVQDVRNVSGRIGGVDTLVQAGRDVVNETETFGVTQTLRDGNLVSTATAQGVQATGTLSASDNAAVLAGRDVKLAGAAVDTGGNALVAAGRNIDVGTVTLASAQDAHTDDGLNGGHTTTTHNVGSTVTTGGSLTTVSGHDTTLTDATVKAGGNATMLAGGDLTVTAAKDTQAHDERSLGGASTKHTASSYDEAAQGSNVNAGGNLLLGAGQADTAAKLLSPYHVSVTPGAQGAGNLAVLGSSVTTGSTAADGSVSGGATKLAATGDVTVGAVTETHDAQSWTHDTKSGFMSGSTMTDTTSSHRTVSAGSTVAGDTVTGSAGHDLTVAGSTVASTGDMALSAGHDLTITTTQDTSTGSHFHEETKSGLGALGGNGISYGNSDQKDTTHDGSVTQNGSLVGSTGGSVAMSAGNNLHVTGSDVIAAQDVTGVAANVTIDSAAGTTHHDETHETKSSGFTLGLAGTLAQLVEGAADQAHAAGNSQDGRASALHAIAAAGDVASTGESLAKAGGKPDIGVQLSWGTSKSKSTSQEDQTTQTGSTVKAGGTAAFVATGDGTPGSGNVTVAGSSVNADNVLLNAKNQVNLVNTTNTDSTRSTNESSSASVGVSYTLGSGWGVSASMSNAHGDANSDAAMQNNTHVTAANNVSIVSGGDTNVTGSNVSGRHVSADVGGNLNIASVQDTTVSEAHQSSSSGGFSISQGGGSGSFSSQHGDAHGNYAGVKEQAGIQAGDGGFDINVRGNTDLRGATIASAAGSSKNTLTTGTLTYSDIQNHSDYSASSSGFSAGASMGKATKATGPSSVSGAGGITPMISQHDSGSSDATTKSAVSAGTITVTDAAKQKQDVASLDRNTTGTNGTVSKLPDVNNLLTNQADVMGAASAAGEAVSTQIGAFADMKRDQALTDAKSALARGDLDAADTALAQFDQWKEGGLSRTLMQTSGGALIGGLGGSNAFTGAMGGAAGAGLSAALAGQTKQLEDAVAGATGSQLLGNIAGNVVSGAGGALVGGSAGAATASNVNLYNQHNDPNETEAEKAAEDAHKLLEHERALLGEAVANAGHNGDIQMAPLGTLIGTGIAGFKGGATTGDVSGPVYSPQGASRAIANGGNWASGSLSQTVQNIAGPKPQITYTPSGKTIYTNPTTGASVVYDNAGDYYRVQNSAGQYLDQGGNVIPNNVPLVGPNKTTQVGVPSGVRNGLTHFNNTDRTKGK